MDKYISAADATQAIVYELLGIDWWKLGFSFLYNFVQESIRQARRHANTGDIRLLSGWMKDPLHHQVIKKINSYILKY